MLGWLGFISLVTTKQPLSCCYYFSIQPWPGSGETNLITQKSCRSSKGSPQFRGAEWKSSIFCHFSIRQRFNPFRALQPSSRRVPSRLCCINQGLKKNMTQMMIGGIYCDIICAEWCLSLSLKTRDKWYNWMIGITLNSHETYYYVWLSFLGVLVEEYVQSIYQIQC